MMMMEYRPKAKRIIHVFRACSYFCFSYVGVSNALQHIHSSGLLLCPGPTFNHSKSDSHIVPTFPLSTATTRPHPFNFTDDLTILAGIGITVMRWWWQCAFVHKFLTALTYGSGRDWKREKTHRTTRSD